MKYFYTLTVDEECLKSVTSDLVERINAFSKRNRPFSVVTTAERLDADEDIGDMALRFHLVVKPDFVVKNEKQALKFCEVMKAAAEEVEAMNGQNYVLGQPVRKPINTPR